MNSSENFGSSRMVAIMASLAMRVMRHSPIAVAVVTGMAVQTPFAKKVTSPEEADDSSLPRSETTVSLILPIWT